LPKRDTYSEPDSHSQHNANTDGDSNLYSDCNAKRYTKANSNAQDSSDTKATSYAARLKCHQLRT
jgi:hypothetical protein